jgi:hypothetical protein
MDHWSVHVAELTGIFYVIDMVFRLAHQRSPDTFGRPIAAASLRDCKSALQSIQNARNESGQRIAHAIRSAITKF